jgi:FkbM family methyltransferase
MNIIKILASRLYLTRQSRRVRSWFAVDGDNSLRLDYPLSKNSVVFDLGGYKGQFASDIFSKYCCSVYVFEPVIAFSNAIQKRFEANDQIKVFSFGLADKQMSVFLNVDSDRSAIALNGDEKIQLVGYADFLEQHSINYLDLVKINIEGAEYDLLDHIIANNLHKKVKNFQIQFHDFVPNAQGRMVSIQKNLEKTHELTWCYPFVWENWRLKERTE